MKQKYSIEEVTERLKITSRTLHYYEEIGLIEPLCRTEGGHRQYNEEVIQKLEHILRLKHHMGSSLQEIRAILEAEETLDRLRESYRKETSDEAKAKILDESFALLQEIVQRIDDKMDKLTLLKNNLSKRLERVQQAQANVNDTDENSKQ